MTCSMKETTEMMKLPGTDAKQKRDVMIWLGIEEIVQLF
jgi:hypothetical protein